MYCFSALQSLGFCISNRKKIEKKKKHDLHCISWPVIFYYFLFIIFWDMILAPSLFRAWSPTLCICDESSRLDHLRFIISSLCVSPPSSAICFVRQLYHIPFFRSFLYVHCHSHGTFIPLSSISDSLMLRPLCYFHVVLPI